MSLRDETTVYRAQRRLIYNLGRGQRSYMDSLPKIDLSTFYYSALCHCKLLWCFLPKHPLYPPKLSFVILTQWPMFTCSQKLLSIGYPRERDGELPVYSFFKHYRTCQMSEDFYIDEKCFLYCTIADHVPATCKHLWLGGYSRYYHGVSSQTGMLHLLILRWQYMSSMETCYVFILFFCFFIF